MILLTMSYRHYHIRFIVEYIITQADVIGVFVVSVEFVEMRNETDFQTQNVQQTLYL